MGSCGFCFTLNNPTNNELPIFPNERYVIWQLEKGANGTSHLQGYIELKKPQRISAIRNLLPRAHIETRKGSREQARDYCRKEDTRVEGPFERGDFGTGGAGRRNDLTKIKERLDEGASDKQLSQEFFNDWNRYHKSFKLYRQINREPRTWKTDVIIYWGDARTGKSKRAHEEYPNAYSKEGGKWWCGYDGHKEVIMDDFYGCIPFTTMLRICDRYKCQVEIKGGWAEFVATTIIITSNADPRSWYPNIPAESKVGLMERYTRIVHFRRGLEPRSREVATIEPQREE